MAASSSVHAVDGPALVGAVSARLATKFAEGLRVAKSVRDKARQLEQAGTGAGPQSRLCCSITPLEETFRWEFKRNVLNQSCTRYPLGVTAQSAEVQTFNAWSPGLESTMAGVALETGVRWTYFGHASGGYRIFPGASGSSCTNYDPRYRPWWLASQSIPKSVIIVMDVSGSMVTADRMGRARDAVTTLLNTLNPDDYVGVVAFDSTIHTAGGCFATQLAAANGYNINLLLAFVASLRPGSGTLCNAAMDAAVSMQANAPPAAKALPTAIIFVSDGIPSDSGFLSRVSTASNTLWFAIGMGLSDSSVLNSIAAAGGTGTSVAIPDDGSVNLRTAMRAFYENPKFAVAASDNCTTTVPYFDSSGLGLVLTIACPTYSAINSLIGVAGVDITLAQVLEDLSLVESRGGYVIMIDAAKRTYLHPKLASPREVNQQPFLVAVDDLELGVAFRSTVLLSMIAGNSGSISTTVSEFQSRGNAGEEGGQYVSVTVTYSWAPVAGTKFLLCIALPSLARPVYAPAIVTQHVYHRLDLVSSQSGQAVGRDGRRGGILTNAGDPAPIPGAKLAPFCFTDQDSYIGRPEGVENVTAYLNWVQTPYSPTSAFSLRLTTPQKLHGDLQLLRQAAGCWNTKPRRNEAFYRYLATESGVLFITPASQYVQEYDPTVRSWYKRAKAAPGKLALSVPYIDAATNIRVVSLSRTVGNSNVSSVFGVAGMDFDLTGIRQLFSQAVPCPVDTQCFLLDDSCDLISSPDGTDLRDLDFMGTRSRLLGAVTADLLNRGMSKNYCLDYVSLKRQAFYDVSVPAGGFSGSTQACGGANVQYNIVPVPNGNFYLVTVTQGETLPAMACCGTASAGCASGASTTTCEAPCKADVVLENNCLGFKPSTSEVQVEPCPLAPPSLRSLPLTASSGLTAGQIAGIVVAGIVAASVLVVMSIYLVKRARMAAAARHAAEQPPDTMEIYNLPPGEEPSAPHLQDLSR